MIYWRALNGSLERVFDAFFGQTRFPVKPEAQKQEAPVTVLAKGESKNA